MKINHVHIDGFGKWHDQDFDFPNNPMLVYGHNEAGKTTLANFILSVLFGFADGRGKNRYLQYLPKDGSSYGGTITVEDDGKIYQIQRTKGTGGGKVTITDSHGHHQPATFLESLVGPLDRDLYRAIYNFGSQDIISEDLSKEQVNAQLQQVGAVGSREWLQKSNALIKAADDIYKPRGRKQPLGQHLKAYDELAQKVNAAREQSTEYQHLQRQIQQLTDRQQQLKAARPALQKQVTDLERLQRLWPIYQQWQSSQQTDQLVANLSDQAVAQIQSLQTRAREINNQVQDGQQERTRLTAQLDSLNSPELQDYRQRKADYQQYKDQLLTLQLQVNQTSDNQKAQWELERKQLVERYHTDQLPAPLSDTAMIELQSLQQDTQPAANYSPLILVGFGSLLILMGLLLHQGLFTVLGLVVVLGGAGWWYWANQTKQAERQQKLAAFGRHHELAQYPVEQWRTMQGDCHRYQDLSRQINQFVQQQHQQADQLIQLRQQLPGHINGDSITEVSADYNRWLTMIADRSSQLDQLQRAQEANTAQLQRLTSQLKEIEQQKQTYYRSIKITSDAEFATYLQERTAAQSQQVTQQAYDQQLSTEDKQALQHYASDEQINHQLMLAHQQLADNGQSQETVTAQLADLRIQLQHLVQDGTYSELQQQLANLQSQLWSETTDWLSHQLAIKWIEKALQLASADRFPQIIEQASQFFATLTNGHYQQINFDKHGITVVTNAGQSFLVEELSLGTEEQLFIALRLGFIMVIADQIQLPILIDDGFVNFDVIRRSKMLTLLDQLASHQQVIYFTADDRIKESSQAVLDLNQIE